jgi:hypothetical protein
MNKASSALLATAGVTVGLLGFALPAGAAVGGGNPAPAVQTQQTQPQNGFQGPNSSNNNNSTWGGQKNGGDKSGWGGQRNPCPTRTSKPCPTRTYEPCPTKPCEPVQTRPCKDKHEHWGYAKAKHTYVCTPKPCPTKAKPCPTKTKPCPTKGKKGSGHQHHQHPQNSGLN